MKRNKVLGLLGLATRANKIVAGTDQVLNALKSKSLKMVFLANDVSEKTFDKINRKCYFYHIPLHIKFNTNELSHATGKPGRKIIGITDDNFYQAIMNELERCDHYEG